MRTLQRILHFPRAGAIGLVVVLLLVTLAGLVYAIPSKAAKRPNAYGPRPAATSAFVQRPPSSLTDWPMFGNNPAHTWVNAGEALLSPSTVASFSRAWSTDVGSICGCSVYGGEAVVAGGIEYVEGYERSAFKGHLVALDEMTGRLLWMFTVDGYLESTPAVANGVVYATNGGTLYALNATTGKLLWSYNAVSAAGYLASPTVVNGIVYVGGSAVNATTGKLLWNISDQSAGDFESSPAVVNGVVYLIEYTGILYALNASTGAVLWKFTKSNSIQVLTSPTVANGIVYISTGNFYAIDAATGTQLWTVAGPAGGRIVNNGLVYVNDSAHLYALDAVTGAVAWSIASTCYGLALANGVLYTTGCQDGSITMLNPSTGATLATHGAGDGALDAVANDMLFTKNQGILYALRPAIRPLTATH